MSRIIGLVILITSVGIAPALLADDSAAAAAALGAESTAYCVSTVNKDRPTPTAVIVAKVNEACALLAKEGPAAFPKFNGKGSPFIYEGTYVVVDTLNEGEVLVHALQPGMVGKKLMGLKDVKGKRFFAIMSDLAKEKGEGWVEYYWPKPGTEEVVRKISFVKKCTMANGVEVAVVSGLFSFNEADVAKLELH
jgi:hypothetical protein